MKENFLFWILQQNVDGIIYDNEESNKIAKQLELKSE